MTGSAWQVTKSVARSRGGVVAAQSRPAAEIGAEILRAGGNAVDAAIATSLALGCVEPWMSGLGGGGCMLAWFVDGGRSWALDFGMIAPRRLDPSAYPLAGGTAGDLFGWPAVVGDRNLHGPRAVAVPGLADGLRLAHERFGSLPLRELAAPAIALAEAGLTVDWYTSQMIAGAARDLRRYPDAAARWLPDGLPPVPPWTGEPFRLSLGPLAQTLRQLAEEGLRSFYTAAWPRRCSPTATGSAIPIDAADLAGYAAGIGIRMAIGYRGGRVLAMPGLYAGASLARCLGLLEGQALAGERAGRRGFRRLWPGAAPGVPRAPRRAGRGGRRQPAVLHVAPQRRRPPRQSRGPDPDPAVLVRQQAAGARHRAAAEQRHHVVRPAPGPGQLDRGRWPAAVQHVPGAGPVRCQAVRARGLRRPAHPAGGAAAHLVPRGLRHEPGRRVRPAANRRQRAGAGDPRCPAGTGYREAVPGGGGDPPPRAAGQPAAVRLCRGRARRCRRRLAYRHDRAAAAGRRRGGGIRCG